MATTWLWNLQTEQAKPNTVWAATRTSYYQLISMNEAHDDQTNISLTRLPKHEEPKGFSLNFFKGRYNTNVKSDSPSCRQLDSPGLSSSQLPQLSLATSAFRTQLPDSAFYTQLSKLSFPNSAFQTQLLNSASKLSLQIPSQGHAAIINFD